MPQPDRNRGTESSSLCSGSATSSNRSLPQDEAGCRRRRSSSMRIKSNARRVQLAAKAMQIVMESEGFDMWEPREETKSGGTERRPQMHMHRPLPEKLEAPKEELEIQVKPCDGRNVTDGKELAWDNGTYSMHPFVHKQGSRGPSSTQAKDGNALNCVSLGKCLPHVPTRSTESRISL